MDTIESHASLFAQLGAILEAAGYSGEGVRATLGAEAGLPVTGLRAAAIYGRRLPADEPISVLIELFSFGQVVDATRAQRALAPLELAQLEAAGVLLVHAGGTVSSTFELQTHGDLLIAGDRGEEAHRRDDFVAGPTPAAITLGRLTLRHHSTRSLDLGTGSGLQALLAAGHSEKVLATDVNPRALWLTELNARLNGIDNLEVREGSWYEPVGSDRFDMIVTNPPYVLSPETDLIYRDSGLSGDTFCEWLVRATPSHLAEGGVAQMLVNWVHGPLDDPFERLRGWVEGSGCDALLLHYGTQRPLTYAMAWNAWAEREPSELETALDRWLDYYERLGIEAISGGAVILRRRATGANWTAPISVPSVPSGPAPAHLARLFAVRDIFGEPPSHSTLLGARLALVQGHTVEQRNTLAVDGYLAEPVRISLDPGLGLDAEIAPEVLSLILACDGRRPLGELLDELSAGTERPEAVRNAALAAAQELTALGYLEAVE